MFVLSLAAIPEILSEDIKDTHVYESTPISFEVTAQGIPKPEAQWLHDGKPIKADSRVKIIEDGNKYKLDITDVKLEDKGEYKVIIKNKLGEKVKQGVLSVSRKCLQLVFRIKTETIFSNIIVFSSCGRIP